MLKKSGYTLNCEAKLMEISGYTSKYETGGVRNIRLNCTSLCVETGVRIT